MTALAISTDTTGYLIRGAKGDRVQRLFCAPLAGAMPLRPAHLRDGAEPVSINRPWTGGYRSHWAIPFSTRMQLWTFNDAGQRQSATDLEGRALVAALDERPLRKALWHVQQDEIAQAKDLIAMTAPAQDDLDLLFVQRQIASAEKRHDDAAALHFQLARAIDLAPDLTDAAKIQRYQVMGHSYTGPVLPPDPDRRHFLFSAALHAMVLRVCAQHYPQVRGLFAAAPQIRFDRPDQRPPQMQGRKLHPSYTFSLDFTTNAIEDLTFVFHDPRAQVSPRLGAAVCYKYALVQTYLACATNDGLQPELPIGLGQRRLSCLVQCGDHLEDVPDSLGYGTAQEYTHVTAMPDVHFFMTRGYGGLRRQLMNNWIPWEKRQAQAFWRGSTTGVYPDRQNLRDFPRYRLCALGAARPDLLDARITRVTATDPDIRSFIEAEYAREGILGQPCPEWEFMRSKIIIVIDGHVNAWGLYGKLLTGSLVFLVGSRWKQWYYDDLRAWEHYVPVAEDLSDLEALLERCLADDALSARIAAQGRNFILERGMDREMPRAARALLDVALSSRPPQP